MVTGAIERLFLLTVVGWFLFNLGRWSERRRLTRVAGKSRQLPYPRSTTS